MKIALAQINPTVGDIPANQEKILDFIRQAANQKAHLVLFSELALTGYPPKDLLMKTQFIDDSRTALDTIAKQCTDISALIGFPCRHEGPQGKALHNAAALLQNGQITATYYKQLLPTYDVFDESRYFHPAKSQQTISCQGKKIGLTICEDIWQCTDPGSRYLYETKPLADLAKEKIDLILNMSASPFVMGKHDIRCDMFSTLAQQYHLPLIYVNQTGGNDELIFDGCSCAFDAKGQLIGQAKAFTEDLLILDTDNPADNRIEQLPSEIDSIHQALLLGLRDYVQKCGFTKVLLGLSGGIDSAITAVLAAQTLGPENVLAVTMPSRYSSPGSITDSQKLAQNLGVQLLNIPIEPIHKAMEQTLEKPFAGLTPDTTEENIQARIRGNILMAISNKQGHLLLTTGNKSELAVGYCTLYGDMAGGLAVISDVPKTMVYQLAQNINKTRQIIPNPIITKPPSAELKPDQTDQDSLPDYDTLDKILHLYVEEELPFKDIVAAGHNPTLTARIISLVDHNEYKRKQAAPGLKVTSRAFGSGRRMPIAQRYRPHQKTTD